MYPCHRHLNLEFDLINFMNSDSLWNQNSRIISLLPAWMVNQVSKKKINVVYLKGIVREKKICFRTRERAISAPIRAATVLGLIMTACEPLSATGGVAVRANLSFALSSPAAIRFVRSRRP